jgi:cysteine dioxygenase
MSDIAIQELVSRLRCCTENDFSGIDRLRELLRTSPVDPKSIERYLIWDRQHYTRNLIDKTALYELVAICWETGQGSSIHNHKEQNCWMAVPIGRLLVQNYKVLSQDLATGTCDLAPSDVIEMNPASPAAVDPDQPVHKVYNPPEFGERAVSLHVYSKPYNSCLVYSAEQHKCGEIQLHYTSEFGVPNMPGSSQIASR